MINSVHTFTIILFRWGIWSHEAEKFLSLFHGLSQLSSQSLLANTAAQSTSYSFDHNSNSIIKFLLALLASRFSAHSDVEHKPPRHPTSPLCFWTSTTYLSLRSLYHVRIALDISGVAAGNETVSLVGGVAVAIDGDVTGSSQCSIVNDIHFWSYHALNQCLLFINTSSQCQLHQPQYTDSTHRTAQDVAFYVTIHAQARWSP